MSRYTITVTGTVTGQGRSDPDAVIGYDPPLRTYFLQAFPHEETDEPGLWLGTHDRAFETLEDVNGGAIPGHWGGVKPGQSGSTEAAREARVSIAL